MKDWAVIVLGTLGFLALLTLGIWLTFFAPCEVFSFAKAGEIPGRCVIH